MGNHRSKCCFKKKSNIVSIDESEYANPYDPYDGYDGTYSVYGRPMTNQIDRMRPNRPDESHNTSIQSETYETYASEILSNETTKLPTLDLVFIVQNDENNSKNCTLFNKKIFRIYLNRFSIESRKRDIHFKYPIFVDRKLQFPDTKQFICDELKKWSINNNEKVQEGFKKNLFEYYTCFFLKPHRTCIFFILAGIGMKYKT